MNLFKPDCYTRQILEGIEVYGYKQVVNTARRITKNSQSLIDFIITNKEHEIRYTNKNLLIIGDHLLCMIDFMEGGVENKDQIAKPVYKYDWSKYSRDNFRYDIACSKFEETSVDTNTVANNLVDNLVQAKDKILPITRVNANINKKGYVPWVDNE